MYATRHTTVLDRRERDDLFDLYQRAYGDIAVTDVSRELLFRHEFDEIMTDATYRTTVIRDDDDRPVALATIATDIGATRYLSRPYFSRHHPRRTAEQRVHYVMWAVVDPEQRGRRVVWELMRAGLAAEAEDGALLVFDLPESNQPDERGGGAELLFRAARTLTDVRLESYGTTRYYAIDFDPAETDADADGGPAHVTTDAADAEIDATGAERGAGSVGPVDPAGAVDDEKVGTDGPVRVRGA